MMRLLFTVILSVIAVSYGNKNNVNPVTIDIYYETLCGDSIRFIKGQLWPTYQALRKTGILNLNLYPYGKAKQTQIKDTWHFTCQHHEKECELNLVETCVKYLYNKELMRYVYCLAKDHTMNGAKSCAAKQNMSWKIISDCTSSQLGNQLQHIEGLKTEALRPRLTNVPWIVVNGKFDPANQKLGLASFKFLVCKTYQGKKPDACHHGLVE